MPGVAVTYRWELRKLASQKRTYLGLAGMVVLPAIFTIGMLLQTGTPEGPFGRYIRETGLAAPLVLLSFASVFLLPLMASLVAGDIVATEDNHGTLKTILTRSVDRGTVFTAKALAALTYALAGITTFGLAALLMGVAAWGLHPLTSLSGSVVAVPRGLLLIAAALGAYLVPLLAIASIAVLLSTVTRNSAASVVGTLLALVLLTMIRIIPGLSALVPYLLTSQFDSWQGLLRQPVDWAPIQHAIWVCALYAIPSLLVAGFVFLRRDVAGG